MLATKCFENAGIVPIEVNLTHPDTSEVSGCVTEKGC